MLMFLGVDCIGKEKKMHMVSEAISRDKFEYILSNFHIADNNLDQSAKPYFGRHGINNTSMTNQ